MGRVALIDVLVVQSHTVDIPGRIGQEEQIPQPIQLPRRILRLPEHH